LIGNRYRLGKPTLGVRESRERRLLHLLPIDSIVSVDSFSEDGRLVRVNWEGMELTLFTQDLVERAVLVKALEITERFFVTASSAIH
jgi:hypothetical protein